MTYMTRALDARDWRYAAVLRLLGVEDVEQRKEDTPKQRRKRKKTEPVSQEKS